METKPIVSIGGSDISAVMGLSRYTTPLELWLQKTGREAPPVDNKYMKAGRMLEPVVVEYFEDQTGIKAVNFAKLYYKSLTLPDYVHATVDRVVQVDKDTRGVLECKTTRADVDPDSPPTEWVMQLNWYLGVTGMKDGYLAWLTRGLDFGWKHLLFDGILFADQVAAAVKFMRYIDTDTPPPPLTADDVAALYPSHITGKYLEATNLIRDTIEELKETVAEISRLDVLRDNFETILKKELTDAEGITVDGEIAVTWRQAKGSERVDVAALREKYPEVHAEFARVAAGSRRFIVKMKKS
jgi:putative phage-type endonuclease